MWGGAQGEGLRLSAELEQAPFSAEPNSRVHRELKFVGWGGGTRAADRQMRNRVLGLATPADQSPHLCQILLPQPVPLKATMQRALRMTSSLNLPPLATAQRAPCMTSSVRRRRRWRRITGGCWWQKRLCGAWRCVTDKPLHQLVSVQGLFSRS